MLRGTPRRAITRSARRPPGDMGRQTCQFDDPTRPAGVWLSNRRQTIAKGLTGNNQDSHTAITPA